jgi:outer membrane protein assembly factor BamB
MDGATVLGRGTTAIAAAALTAIGGIGTPSNPATDFIVMSRSAGSAIEGMEAQYQVRAEFTSAFQITFTRLDTDGNANEQVDIAYEVVRLQDGGGVQRGSTVSSGTTTTMGAAGNIAAVDRSATVPFFSASGGSTSGSAASQSQVLDETSWMPTFPSTTQLQFTRGTSSSIVGTAGWFVVSFYKCANSRLCSVSATGGDASATVSWSPIYDPQCLSGSTPTSCQALVVRDTAAITWAPANGTTYTVGTQPAGGPGTMRVAFNGTGQSVSQTVTNGTEYYYRVYPRINGTTNYITDAGLTQAMTQVSVTPGASLAWSHVTTGGSTLNAPIAGDGRVYVASNGGKMIALDSSTGVELATAAIKNGSLQSYLAWFPVSGGTSEAVLAGDGKGWLTRFDGVTGERVWTTQLPVDDIGLSSTGYIQAAVSVQLRDYALCDGGTFQSAYSTDIIFVASRENSQTANKVWAVRADTGAVVWTSTPGTAMDRAAGQPYVDYCRNRLWVSTGNNAGQRSVWVIDTITGAEVASFSGAGDQNGSAPTLSWDSNTVWVGDAAGTLYAFDSISPAFNYSLQLGGVSPAIFGFIWEDWFTPGRLYVPVSVGGARGVWCVQDTGAFLTACSDWPVNPRTVTTGVVAQPMASETAIFLPGTDGKIYQVNTSDGALYQDDGRPFTVESGVALGGLSTEDGTQLFVGTTSGRSYRIDLVDGNLP